MDYLLNFMSFLFTEVVPVFAGGSVAFYFGLKLYKKQKREENRSYLHYAISALSHLNNELYNFKKQIAVPRYNEARALKSQILRGPSVSQLPVLRFEETVKYLYIGGFQSEIDMGKLDFLVSRDPNLIILLGSLISSVKSLNHVVSDINSEVSDYIRQTRSLDNMPSVMLMLEKNELLHTVLDNTIYLTEKFQSLLIEFGGREYGRKMIIQSTSVLGTEYEELKPEPIKSWEENYTWLPKKRSWWQKLRLKDVNKVE